MLPNSAGQAFIDSVLAQILAGGDLGELANRLSVRIIDLSVHPTHEIPPSHSIAYPTDDQFCKQLAKKLGPIDRTPIPEPVESNRILYYFREARIYYWMAGLNPMDETIVQVTANSIQASQDNFCQIDRLKPNGQLQEWSRETIRPDSRKMLIDEQFIEITIKNCNLTILNHYQAIYKMVLDRAYSGAFDLVTDDCGRIYLAVDQWLIILNRVGRELIRMKILVRPHPQLSFRLINSSKSVFLIIHYVDRVLVHAIYKSEDQWIKLGILNQELSVTSIMFNHYRSTVIDPINQVIYLITQNKSSQIAVQPIRLSKDKTVEGQKVTDPRGIQYIEKLRSTYNVLQPEDVSVVPFDPHWLPIGPAGWQPIHQELIREVDPFDKLALGRISCGGEIIIPCLINDQIMMVKLI